MRPSDRLLEIPKVADALVTQMPVITLREPAPAEVAVGAAFELVLAVHRETALGDTAQDSRLSSLAIMGPGGQTRIVTADAAGEFSPVVLIAPRRVGEHVWIITPAQEARPDDAPRNAPSDALCVTLRTVPIKSSMAAWDIPDSVVAGEGFTITVGAKSAAAHQVCGETVEVCDEASAVIGRGVLSDAPWPGTDALHWTQIELTAPAEPGLRTWSARFAGGGLELAHEASSCAFSVLTVKQADHSVTVTVRERESGAPVVGMLVRLGAERATTNHAGVAVLRSWAGSQDLAVWHQGFHAPAQRLDVTRDMSVDVAVEIVPEEDPDAPWKM